MVDTSARLRRIARALTRPVRSHSMPVPVTAVLLLSLAFGWMFFAYGQRTNISFHTIWRGGGGPRSNLVINDQAAWSSFWTTHVCPPAQCPIPEVNFTLRTVLVAALGPQPHTGYAINITRVTGVGSSVVVDVKITLPGPSCGYYEIYGVSYSHIVDIPKAQGPLTFRTETTVGCGA